MINPLFKVIENNVKLPNLDDVIFDIQDLISFNISLDGVGIKNLAINETLTDDSRFINLYDDDKIRLT